MAEISSKLKGDARVDADVDADPRSEGRKKDGGSGAGGDMDASPCTPRSTDGGNRLPGLDDTDGAASGGIVSLWARNADGAEGWGRSVRAIPASGANMWAENHG